MLADFENAKANGQAILPKTRVAFSSCSDPRWKYLKSVRSFVFEVLEYFAFSCFKRLLAISVFPLTLIEIYNVVSLSFANMETNLIIFLIFGMNLTLWNKQLQSRSTLCEFSKSNPMFFKVAFEHLGRYNTCILSFGGAVEDPWG